tara:strand:+ start:919 stop:1920 length:1002 start_codon:yes stop_codon:yes gene_type:complete
MGTYKEIFGKYVQVLASDPAAAVSEGQIWYNSTTGTFKGTVAGGAWASGGALGTARTSMGSLGTQTANMVVGGQGPPGGALSNTAQTYNGTSWTNIPSLSAAARRSNAGFGTTSAAASLGGSIGGLPPTANTVNYVEEYDGSSWTAVTGYPVGTYDIEACGTQTAGLGAGGYITPSDPGTTVNTNNDYDGSSWTGNPAMNNVRNNFSMTGTQTAALVAGGTGSPTKAETFNGSTWTAITDITTTKMSAASGTTTAALVYGGSGPGSTVATTFKWDGSSWSTDASMATARTFLGGSSASPGSLALATGGYVGTTLQTITEEYALANTVKTLTTS